MTITAHSWLAAFRMGVAAPARPVPKPVILDAAVTEIDQASGNAQVMARAALEHGWVTRIVTASAVDPVKGLIRTVTVRCRRGDTRIWAAWLNGRFDCAWFISPHAMVRLGATVALHLIRH